MDGNTPGHYHPIESIVPRGDVLTMKMNRNQLDASLEQSFIDPLIGKERGTAIGWLYCTPTTCRLSDEHVHLLYEDSGQLYRYNLQPSSRDLQFIRTWEPEQNTLYDIGAFLMYAYIVTGERTFPQQLQVLPPGDVGVTDIALQTPPGYDFSGQMVMTQDLDEAARVELRVKHEIYLLMRNLDALARRKREDDAQVELQYRQKYKGDGARKLKERSDAQTAANVIKSYHDPTSTPPRLIVCRDRSDRVNKLVYDPAFPSGKGSLNSRNNNLAAEPVRASTFWQAFTTFYYQSYIRQIQSALEQIKQHLDPNRLPYEIKLPELIDARVQVQSDIDTRWSAYREQIQRWDAIYTSLKGDKQNQKLPRIEIRP